MPLAILGIAGVVGSLAKAKIQSNAAKDAAKHQIASTEKAQGYNQQVYHDQRSLMSPYVNAGNESLARLMSQHWGTPYQPPAPYTGGQPQPPNQAVPRFGGPMGPPPPGPNRPNPNTPRLVGSGQSLGAMQQPQQGPGPQGQMVQMQAPDGSVQAVPAAAVAQLEQRGARRMS
jgi:hypothetical protein